LAAYFAEGNCGARAENVCCGAKPSLCPDRVDSFE
jgi:hypothetical protein